MVPLLEFAALSVASSCSGRRRVEVRGAIRAATEVRKSGTLSALDEHCFNLYWDSRQSYLKVVLHVYEHY